MSNDFDISHLHSYAFHLLLIIFHDILRTLNERDKVPAPGSLNYPLTSKLCLKAVPRLINLISKNINDKSL